MLILAIDTAAETGSIALARESNVIEQVSLHAPRGFGQVLFGEIDALLKRKSVGLGDIGLFAATKGPGSFTGIRIGLAAIKGMAEVMQKPAIGISNLEVLAQFGTQELRAPVIDAKRGEVYAALYDRQGAAIVAPVVTALPRFLEVIGDRKPEWISADFLTPPEGIAEITPAPKELAGKIASLALDRYRRGDPADFDPARLEADYVRRSDAEIFWKG